MYYNFFDIKIYYISSYICIDVATAPVPILSTITLKNSKHSLSYLFVHLSPDGAAVKDALTSRQKIIISPDLNT